MFAVKHLEYSHRGGRTEGGTRVLTEGRSDGRERRERPLGYYSSARDGVDCHKQRLEALWRSYVTVWLVERAVADKLRVVEVSAQWHSPGADAASPGTDVASLSTE